MGVRSLGFFPAVLRNTLNTAFLRVSNSRSKGRGHPRPAGGLLEKLQNERMIVSFACIMIRHQRKKYP